MKKKLKRKLLAGILCACMIFQTAGAQPIFAVGDTVDSGTSTDTYAVYQDGKFYEAAADAPTVATQVEIADTDKGTIQHLYSRDSSVPDELMYECKNLKTVIMPNVTTIGYQVFSGCTSLTRAELPNVTTMGGGAFFDCTRLTRAELPNVTTMGDGAFFYCTSLTRAELPEATTIGNNAFSGCTSLTSVILPNVTTIGNQAFYDCTSLTIDELPKVTTIGAYAFFNCTSLTRAELPEVTTIGDAAFDGCTSLTRAELPKVETIGEAAFSGCISLTIDELPEATTMGEGAFLNCTSLTSAELPKATTIGINAFLGCISLTRAELPKATTIGDYAFNGCEKLESILLSNATSIGDFAFYDCAQLAKLELPEVTTIGDHAFFGCTSLTRAELQKATTIGNNAFDGCTSLTRVELPELETIGDHAFWVCTNLTSLILGTTPPTVGTEAFYFTSPSRMLTILGDQATGATVIGEYNAVTDDDINDGLWYGWTLPSKLVYPSTVTLQMTAGNAEAVYGEDNAITVTATLDKAATQTRALSADQIEIFIDESSVEIMDATLIADDKWTATFQVNTKDWDGGKHKITAQFAGNEDLNGAKASIAVTINQAEQETLTMAGVPATATYGDSALNLSSNGGSGTGTVTTYTSSNPEVISISGTTATILKSGSATITATKAGDTNYKDAIVTSDITVNKKKITITADNQSKVYGTENQTFTVTIPSGALVSGDTEGTLNVTLTTLATKNAKVGDYTITGTGSNEKYDVTVIPGTLQITKKPLTADMISGIADSYDYMGESIQPAPTVADGTPSIITAGDYTVTYGTNKEVATGGTVTITATDNGNYSGTARNTFTIGKVNPTADLTVDRTDKTYVYGDTITFTVKVELPKVKSLARTAVIDTVDFYLGTDTANAANKLNSSPIILTEANGTGTATFTYDTTAYTKISFGDAITVTAEYGGSANLKGQTVSITGMKFQKKAISGTAAIDVTNGTSAEEARIDKGDTLTANVTAIQPMEAQSGLTCQWYRGTDKIQGATTSTYVVTDADRGQKLHVEVTAEGNYSGVIASPEVEVDKEPIKGSIFITGSTALGDTLTLDRTSLTPTGATVTTKWQRDGVDIPEATAETYQLTRDDLGKTITVVITATSPFTGSMTATREIPSIKPENPVVTTTAGNEQVTITWKPPFDGGSAITGYELTVTPSVAGSPFIIAGDATSYTVTGLTNGIEYEFILKAINGNGHGENTNPVSAVANTSGDENASSGTDDSLTEPSAKTGDTAPLARLFTLSIVSMATLLCFAKRRRRKSTRNQ